MNLETRECDRFRLGAAVVVLWLAAAAPPHAAVPVAWQLLDDGDPSPGNWPLAYDSTRQRVVLETGGAYTVTGIDGPAIHWELIGDDWVRVWLPEPTPKQSSAVCMTYDSTRHVSIMFGAGVNLDETWEFDGSTWTHKMPVVSPPGRALCGLTYDPVNRKTVMFGGTTDGSNGLADTWEWDGTNWTQIFPHTSPIARNDPSMTYDANAQRIIMFGGSLNNSALNDTWYYDAQRQRWTQQSPSASPPARKGAGIACDSVRQRVAIFGGESIQQDYGDTWEWDGNNWAQINTPQAPAPRNNFHMVFDTARGTVVGFGGGPSIGFNDTWTYDGTSWTRLQTTTLPPPRQWAGMAYDPPIGGLVLFGGVLATLPQPGHLNDTWQYVNGEWSLRAAAGVPSDAAEFSLTFDPQANGVRGFSGVDATGWPNNADIHRYEGSPPAWSSIPSIGPAPRVDASWVYDPGLGGIFMYGGLYCCDLPGHLALSSATWLLSGDSWTLVAPEGTGPTARSGAAAAYDSLRGRVIVYGGSRQMGNDRLESGTFAHIPDGWYQIEDPSPPGGRAWNGMTYDAARDVVVLFGTGPIDEGVTWEFDGTQWHARTTPFEPDSSRAYFQMAYDPVKNVSYLFGGADLNTRLYYQDFWAYGPDPDGDGIVGGLDNCPNAPNPTQANLDGDAAGDACDCAVSDPSAWAVPQPVAGLMLSGSLTTTLTWGDQSSSVGPGVLYDVATGDLIQLQQTGSYAGASCLANQTAMPSASDGRSPVGGSGYWYLVRARNVCGVGTYDSATLDGASPCP